MKPQKDTDPLPTAGEPTRFVLIFSELGKQPALELSTEEIDAIGEIGRIVMEVTDERPIFMTST
jgi:hypothetical protein